ncbi:MAG: WGxxGxxG-CTERM domain-containing protein [Herpetosiphonaceae bacterium]|nr:WGxxGxxG-CTERM domain-containing protein [Herpetosiphonaceae bacterium]
MFLGVAGIVTRDTHVTQSAYAQAATTTATAVDTTVTTQPVQQTSNPFPYGLLGLLGLAGLAGLRRPQPQPVMRDSTPGEAKVYDTRK